MRRLLLFFLICSIFFPTRIFSETYTIETSRGPQELILPDGVTIEEGFLQMASLYLEERFDLEESLENVDHLLGEIDNLNFAIEEYRVEVSEYKRRVEDAVVAYEKEMEPVPLSLSLGGFASTPLGSISPTFGGLVSVGIFERALVLLQVGYPLTVGIGFSWRL